MPSMLTMTVPWSSKSATTDPATCCPDCGARAPSAQLLQDAQRQIEDLQSQVRLLNEKASFAIDRWADYEDELARLRAELQKQQQPPPPPPPPTSTTPPPSSWTAGGLSALLAPLRQQQQQQQQQQTPASAAAPPTPAHSREPSSGGEGDGQLLEALSREQGLRRAAEGRLSDTSREVEELSAQLFEQANEMVAAERRARAALEDRVGELERRDRDKRRRLERLESAVGRIERVRKMLGS